MLSLFVLVSGIGGKEFHPADRAKSGFLKMNGVAIQATGRAQKSDRFLSA